MVANQLVRINLKHFLSVIPVGHTSTLLSAPCSFPLHSFISLLQCSSPITSSSLFSHLSLISPLSILPSISFCPLFPEHSDIDCLRPAFSHFSSLVLSLAPRLLVFSFSSSTSPPYPMFFIPPHIALLLFC